MSLENQGFQPRSDKSDNTRHSEFVGSRKSDRHGHHPIGVSDVRSGQNSSDEAGRKGCRTCKLERPIIEFPVHRGSRDGHRNDCRYCLLTGRYRPYIENKRQRARRKRRERKPAWQSTHRKALRKYELHNPQKAAAVRALNRAVKRGTVKKAKCCQVRGCRSRRFLEGHHFDYAAPLDVLWCCASHHRQGHAQGFIIPKRGYPAHYGRIPDMLEAVA
jgi:hypothetical protein